jgi:outer membrane lipoprotein-sorting protein
MPVKPHLWEEMALKKKFWFPLALLLVFVLLLPLYGCGGGDKEEEPAEETASSEEISMDELFGKAKDIDGYSYDYLISEGGSGQALEGKMYLKGMKQRMEMTTEEGQMIQIVDLEAKKAFSYMPDQQMAFEVDLSQLESPETPSDYVDKADTVNAKNLGKEEINGMQCHKYSIEDEESSVVYWVHDEYGLPVKIETTAGDVVTTMELKNFEVGNIGDDLFKLPSGVQVQSISDMMQNLPAAP